MRANVEAARDAGVHLIFMTGNEVFWRTRYEPSIAGPATPDRTLVCYKESIDNAKIDPSPQWTGTWRDPRFSPPAQGGGAPENALTGQLFAAILPTGEDDFADRGALRVLAVPLLAQHVRRPAPARPGEGAGAEHAWASSSTSTPTTATGRATSIRLSSTTVSAPRVLQDYADTYAPGHGHPQHDALPGAERRARCGAPERRSGRTGSTSTTRPMPACRRVATCSRRRSTCSATWACSPRPGSPIWSRPAARSTPCRRPPRSRRPPQGAQIPVATPVTITGTVAEAGGGQVAWVEVSVDDGVTWKRATGTLVVELCRGPPVAPRPAHDPSPGDRRQLQPRGQRPDAHGHGRSPADALLDLEQRRRRPRCRRADDSSAVEVGVKFRPLTDGFITGLRFYKGQGNGGVHVGNLWTSSGTRLAQATFANETGSGWQTVSFPPVAVSAGADVRGLGAHAPGSLRPRRLLLPERRLRGVASPRPRRRRGGRQRRLPLRRVRLPVGDLGGRQLLGRRRVRRHQPRRARRSSTRSPAAGLQSVSRTSPVTVDLQRGDEQRPRSCSSCARPPVRSSHGTTTYDGPTRTLSFVAGRGRCRR